MTILLDAEFRELINRAIPEIIALFSHRDLNVRRACANAFSILSEQGNISNFLT
jgi:hypothetical protein